VVVVLALAGLSACRTKAGAAAFVGGHRITDSDVNKFLTVKSTPYTNQSGTEVRPRSVVLATLIQEQLLEKALTANGGAPTDAELGTLKASVLQGATDEQLTTQITGSNFKAAFEPLYIRSQELFGLFGQRTKAQSSQELVAGLDKIGIRVQVSSRYGTWDSTQLALKNGLDPGLSGVLTLDPTTSAAPSPQP
jgi:hypothetical protein